jgi:O-antigen/teichoic acid export membrane protein
MAFAPLITRLYGPEAFGMLGTFMAVVAVLAPVAALAYTIAIVLPKSDADAKTLAKLSVGLAIVVASITALALLIGGDWIAQALSLEDISNFLLLIPIAMLFSAYQQILNQWLIRKMQFKITARVALLQAIMVNSAKVGVGLFHPVGAALVIIAVIGRAFHPLLLWWGLKNRAEACPRPEDEPTGSVKELATRHCDFPMYRAPQSGLNALSESLPVLILSVGFGPLIAGFFALTKSVLTAPVSLVAQSVGNVFYPKAVELRGSPKRLRSALIKSTGVLILIGSFMFMPVIVAGPWLFSLIFGFEWEKAGQFAQWVSIWMITSLAARPTISMIPVLNIQKEFLVFEIIFLPIAALSLYFGIHMNDAIISVITYCMVSSVFYVALFGFVVRKVDRY